MPAKRLNCCKSFDFCILFFLTKHLCARVYVCVCARVMLFPSWNEQKGYEMFHERCISTTENKMEINILSSLRWELLQPWAVFCCFFFLVFLSSQWWITAIVFYIWPSLNFPCPALMILLISRIYPLPLWLWVSRCSILIKYTVTLWLLNIWYSFRFTFSRVKQKKTFLTVSPLWNPFDFHL